MSLLDGCSDDVKAAVFRDVCSSLMDERPETHAVAQGAVAGLFSSDAYVLPSLTELGWQFQVGDAPLLVLLALAVAGVKRWRLVVQVVVARTGVGGLVLRSPGMQGRIVVAIMDARLAAGVARIAAFSPRKGSFTDTHREQLKCAGAWAQHPLAAWPRVRTCALRHGRARCSLACPVGACRAPPPLPCAPLPRVAPAAPPATPPGPSCPPRTPTTACAR